MAVINAITPDEAEARLSRWAQRFAECLVEAEQLGVFADENLTAEDNVPGGTLTMVASADGSTVPWPAPLLARAAANYAVARAAGVWGRTIISNGKTPLQYLQGLIRATGR